ncbi:MAG TPA: hypothetical protein VGM74_11220 [Burkholderiaceae bacterium]|jgi:serine O-acetyltransferase
MRQSLAETCRLIRADIEFRCRYEHKKASRLTAFRLMFHPGGASVVLYRWQRFFDTNGVRVVGAFVRWLNLLLFTSQYSSQAEIAGGFLVVHAVANYIEDGVVIGPRCIMFSQNSLSRSPFVEQVDCPPGGVPVVENDVIFGVGACAQGAVRIGAGCRIGMNTLIDFNTEPGSVLLGVPARVTRRYKDAAP